MREEVLKGRVRDVVESGDAVVETAQGLVFVRGALTGEEILLRPLPGTGRIKRGKLVRVELASSERIDPPCPHVTRCGGCPFMHMTSAAQRAIKLGFLREALRKTGAATVPEIQLFAATEVLGYRRRARLSFRATKKGMLFGFRRGRSDELIDIDHCLVLEPRLDRALSLLRSELGPLLSGQGEVDLALGRTERAVISLRAQSAQAPELYRVAERLSNSEACEGLALSVAGSPPARIGEPEEHGTGADGQPLRGTISGFSQAHAEINAQLVAHVAELAETREARVLELYAGHGNLTVALAPGAARYTAVEQDAVAAAALRENLSRRQLSVAVQVGLAEQHLGKGALDVVVLDPPRAGAPGVLEKLVERKPRRIVYVSCDPATLGRDLGEALARGYEIDRAAAFEMFPQTADLESVVRLRRAQVGQAP